MRQLLLPNQRIVSNAGNRWALADDGVQWILLRHSGQDDEGWVPVSYVHSGKDVLAGSMREQGVDDATAAFLLRGLSDTFQAWKALRP